ncbi:MAG: hypothetical protein SNF68_02170 [Rikenellaceae bacterium]
MRSLLISSFLLLSLSTIEAQVISLADVGEDWIEVSGVSSSLEDDRVALEQMAQRDAIQRKIGSSITFSDHSKEYADQYKNYAEFLEVRSELLDGVWKGNKVEPKFYTKVEEIESERRGRKQKVELYCCEVEGYVTRIRTMPVAFEYRILDRDGAIIAEHPSSGVPSKAAYNQNDEMVVEFRTSQGGHLTLFLDDGENAYRLLPYSYYSSHSDIKIEAQRLYRLFDRAAAEYGLRDYVDEIVMATDQELDAFRLYFIFSQSPLSRDFFLSNRASASLADGVEALMSIESREFARWLQQSRMVKDDLQVAIADLIIENR